MTSPRSTDASMTPAEREQEIPVIPRRRWKRLAVAYLTLGAVALLYAPRANPEAWWLHGTWCLTGLAVALPTLSLIVRKGFALVLTEHRLMFLASFSVYFLFGAALPAIGPQIQADAVMNHFPTDVRDALRADGVNSIGFGLALLAAAFTRARWFGGQAARIAAQVSRLPPSLVIAFLLLAGAAASYRVLTFDMDPVQRVPVSGSMRSLAQLVIVAIVLAVSRAGTGERTLRILGTLVALGLASLSVLAFNKSGVMLPLAAVVAGLALRFDSKKVLPIGLALLVSVFFTLGNAVNLARLQTYGEPNMGQARRWEALKESWDFTRELVAEEEYAYWGRLCYLPTQNAGLHFQDDGRGGDGLQLMWWVAVPRFLAPQKPEITKTGRELYEKITGNATSSDGQGIFASGYYHGGWWGLVLASVLCGWVVAHTSAVARAIHVQQALMMLPLSLLGLFIAFRIDGDFVSDYLGAFMFILYPVLTVSVLLWLFGPAPRREVSSS